MVAVRARLSERLKEQQKQQQVALAAAVRCQHGLDAAWCKADELAAQGARLVSDAEQALAEAIGHLVRAMGSVELAAAVLDLEETAVRKAMAIKPAGGRANREAAQRPTATAMSASKKAPAS